jgi:hypothetical protein
MAAIGLATSGGRDKSKLIAERRRSGISSQLKRNASFGGSESYWEMARLFVVGADLAKAPEVLLPAYDDAHGVTATFNRNLLARIN